MTRETVHQMLRMSRRDLGRLLFHFTRGQPINPFTGQPQSVAFDQLRSILASRAIKGSSGYVKGGHSCVSFTEAPVTEIASLFAMATNHTPGTLRYEPYGIAVTKESVFRAGGRPVIYQPDSEYQTLPPQLQWRHVRYDPPDVDFTWEREWRVPTTQFNIDPQCCLVVVRSAQEAHSINYSHSVLQQHQDPMTGGNIISSTATWIAVSLDLFGV